MDKSIQKGGANWQCQPPKNPIPPVREGLAPSRHMGLAPSRHMGLAPSRHMGLTPSRHTGLCPYTGEGKPLSYRWGFASYILLSSINTTQ
jgi:hypothetical protein